MHVRNVHEREFDLPLATVGEVIDTLASKNDRLWPREAWPPMRFDRPLSVGAVGGHGPVRYSIEEYQPGRLILFRFLGPSGFNGTHRFEVEDQHGRTVLRHVLEMRAVGRARLSWPLLFRPLHNALIEDGFDRAAASLGVGVERPARHSISVRALRAVVRTLHRPGAK
jgi:hypothetical protein